MVDIDFLNHSMNNTTDNYNESEYYYYDYDISVSSIPLGEILPLTLAYGLTLLIGIVGNFLVIFAVCRYKRLRSITNSFLTSLAIADLLLLLICIPIKCAAFASFSWTFGEFLCKFVNYMQNVSMICSVMTLTVMSIERWVAILYPLKAKYLCTYSHARQMIAVIWTTSFIMAIPVLIGQKHILVGERIKAYWCITDWYSTEMEILFEVYRFTLLFVIPMTVMIIAYTGICKELLQLSSVRGNLTSSSSCGKRTVTATSSDKTASSPLYGSSDSEKLKKKNKTDDVDEKTMKVIQMLIVVVVLFAICWGPILINNLLVAVGAIEKYHYDYLKPMRQAFFLMSYFNSCSNPIVYGFMSKHFRRSFQRAIMSCLCCRDEKSFHKIRYSLNATKSTVVYSGHLNRNRQRQDIDKEKEGGQFYRTNTASPMIGIKLSTLASPSKRKTINK